MVTANRELSKLKTLLDKRDKTTQAKGENVIISNRTHTYYPLATNSEGDEQYESYTTYSFRDAKAIIRKGHDCLWELRDREAERMLVRNCALVDDTQNRSKIAHIELLQMEINTRLSIMTKIWSSLERVNTDTWHCLEDKP
jgi:hypothetical protein